ncbi:MAG: HD family phosphohydrolase [Elusimicrobiota bacterium]
MPIIDLKKIKQILKSKSNFLFTNLIIAGILITFIYYYTTTIESLAGVFTLTASIILMGFLLFKTLCPRIFDQSSRFTLSETVILLFLLIIILIDTTRTLSGYFIPTGAAAILLTVLTNPINAIINVIIISLLAGIIGDFSLNIFFVSLIGGIAGIYSSRNVRTRSDLHRSGWYILLANVIGISGISLIHNYSLFDLSVGVVWGAGNAFISMILASGLLPLFENLFRITTNVRLLELADFNQPVLKRLMMEAPGTYHHSLLVGNLAENACEKIGANPLLARVGAYYHDIGKLKNPQYFIENQMHATDRHKNLKPNISALILKRHVKDGLAIAEQYNLDNIIKDLIIQHHGTTLIEYFYKKDLEEVKDESKVPKKEYRYPGPRPHIKEAGVLMLADSVEAACRTLEEPSYSRISSLVTKIINNKFIDNQLNNCDITLANLEEIQKSFTKTLSGIYHSRIEYPEGKEETE